MDIRQVEPGDSDAIVTVARASMSASYEHLVEQETIARVVADWYGPERLDEIRTATDERLLVAIDEGDVVGFAHGSVVHDDPIAAELQWLHVSPNARRQTVGVRLLGQMVETFEDLGAAVFRGMVLTGNEDGRAFFEAHGFERVGTRGIEIDGEPFEEVVYQKSLGDKPGEQIVETLTGPGGAERYVNLSAAEHGTAGPLFPVYRDRAFDQPHGFQCGNCDSLDTAMDSMERIVCSNCGNKRRAKRWDASYL